MRFLAGSVVLVAFACAACSGAGSAAPGDGTSEDPSKAAPTPAVDDPAKPAKPAKPAAPPPTMPKGGVTAPDAGAAEAGSGGGGGGGGGGGASSQCAAESVHETEPNDSAATANAIPGATGSFCGALSSATDSDYISFVLPANAKTLGFGSQYSQQGVELEGAVDGVKFNVGETPAFKPGATYVFRAFTTGKAPASYRFSVTITK